MGLILAIPLFLRFLWLFVVGACIGSFINVCVIRLPEYESVVRGGSKCRSCQARIRWFDNIPILSWIWLRGKCRSCKAAISWQYPAVELITGLLFAGLYWWEVVQEGLIPTVGPAGGLVVLPPGLNRDWLVHGLFLSHVILAGFMVASTVIDLRDQIIPDEFTVPGTVAGLILAAAWPWVLLPQVPLQFPVPADLEFLVLTHDQAIWPAWLDRGAWDSLAIAIACLLAWCVGLLPWSWKSRRGWKIAAAILWRGMRSDYLVHGLAVGGSIAIWLGWRYLPHDNWMALVSALVGMVWGGGYTWLIRFVAGAAMGKEALGFGDVVLMAMFGAFLGWQGVTIVFFVAPFFGLIGAMLQFVSRDGHIPYGPSLCVGALAVIVWWVRFWEAFRSAFVTFGWLLPGLLLGSTVLLAVMLLVLRGLKAAAGIGGYDDEEETGEEGA